MSTRTTAELAAEMYPTSTTAAAPATQRQQAGGIAERMFPSNQPATVPLHGRQWAKPYGVFVQAVNQQLPHIEAPARQALAGQLTQLAAEAGFDEARAAEWLPHPAAQAALQQRIDDIQAGNYPLGTQQ